MNPWICWLWPLLGSWLGVLAPTAAPPPPDPTALARALAELPERPDIASVQAAALRRATLDPRTAKHWLRRARAAALLPTVMGEVDQRADQGWRLDQSVGDSDALQQDLGAGRVMRLRATWHLDRMIFNPDELRAARAALDLADTRERLLLRVTQLYFERHQLLVELATLSPRDAHEAIGRHIRLAELEAILVGLTGLQFPRPAAGKPSPAKAHAPTTDPPP